jgi:hypothetical protein
LIEPPDDHQSVAPPPWLVSTQKVTDDDSQEALIMQLHCYPATLSSIRDFSAPIRCSTCGDWMVAPLVSEFVEGGEIRHYWKCDACGEPSSTSIELGESDIKE